MKHAGPVKITVLQTFKSYYPEKGGIQTVMKDIVFNLRGFFNFKILVSRVRGLGRQEKEAGVFVRRCMSLFTLFSLPIAPFYIFWFWWYARRVEIVDHHYPFPWVDIAVSIYFPKKTKLIIHWHAEIIAQKGLAKWLAPCIRKCLQRAHKVVVATPLHIDNSPYLSTMRDKCVVIPFGTDVKFWATLTAKQQQQVAELKTHYPQLLLVVGRLVAYKGIDKLIPIMQELDAQLILVGDGPQRRLLQGLITQYNLADKIMIKSDIAQDELKILLHAAKTLILPSVLSSEAFGIVQIEAMSCAKSIINTSLNSGVEWVARDQQEALTVPPGDSSALMQAIKKLLADPELANRLGQAGFKRAQEMFSQEKFSQAMKDLYENVLYT